MHRELFGEIDEGYVVDHIDRDKLNNTKENLRITTQRYNSANSKPRKGTSKYKGVSWNKQAGKWASKIEKDGSFYSLGQFYCEENAALAYNIKAIELFGEFAYLNDVSISEIDQSKEYAPSSKYTGVSYMKRVGKWRAYIRVNGKQEHLGYFKNENEAAEKYNNRAKEVYGKDAVLNEI